MKKNNPQDDTCERVGEITNFKMQQQQTVRQVGEFYWHKMQVHTFAYGWILWNYTEEEKTFKSGILYNCQRNAWKQDYNNSKTLRRKIQHLINNDCNYEWRQQTKWLNDNNLDCLGSQDIAVQYQ